MSGWKPRRSIRKWLSREVTLFQVPLIELVWVAARRQSRTRRRKVNLLGCCGFTLLMVVSNNRGFESTYTRVLLLAARLFNWTTSWFGNTDAVGWLLRFHPQSFGLPGWKGLVQPVDVGCNLRSSSSACSQS